MDVFDSSDTPDVSSRPLTNNEPLPLSVDEDERRNLPTHDSAPLSSGSPPSPSSDYSGNTLSHDYTGYRDPTELPTSIDDVMIPSTQPSKASLADRARGDWREVSDKLESAEDTMSEKWNEMRNHMGSSSSGVSHHNDRDHSSGTLRDTDIDSRSANVSDSVSDKLETAKDTLSSKWNVLSSRLSAEKDKLSNSMSSGASHNNDRAHSSGTLRDTDINTRTASDSLTDMKHSMSNKLHQAENYFEKEKDSLQSRMHTSSTTSTSSSSISASQPLLSSESDLPLADNDDINAMPTSIDDVMMPHIDYTTHPSVLSGPSHTSSDIGDRLKRDARLLEDKLSTKASGLKADVNEKLSQPHYMQPSNTHPLASSMRDADTHPGQVSLPTHDNESYSAIGSGTVHRSAAHQRALDAAAATYDSHNHEPKEHSAGLMGALSAFSDKLEHGADMLKERVMHGTQHAKDSERFGGNVPTLIDKNNATNAAIVQSRLHPSSERAGDQPVQ